MQTFASTIRARKMDFPFGADIPRHWFAGSVFATHMANGLNLLFPLGERFFVRSVRAFAEAWEHDPKLAADVRGFAGQEVRHGLEHERFFEILEAQGFDVKGFLAWYEKVAYGPRGIEAHTSKKLRLAVTVALEHYTASFAERALSGAALDAVHPTMRDLLRWHAAEEIEHKAVAFDVLMKVDPSYALRVAGMIVATLGLFGFWAVATTALLRQDAAATRSRVRRERARARAAGHLGPRDWARAFFTYLRPGFHPSQNDDAWLARRQLEAMGVT